MDSAGLGSAIWSEFRGGAFQAGWYAIVFAMVFPLEIFFGAERRASWGERLGNFGAMLVHLGLGGLALSLLLATPVGKSLAAYPQEPRHEALANPCVWALASVFFVDGAFYWYHRLQHASPLFWRVHKLHHTDPAMNITTSRRTHFLERALQYFCLSVPMFWVLGMNVKGMTYAVAATAFFLYFSHADVRLDIGWLTPIIVGPMYHRLHHSRMAEHQGVNFAQAFPIFDILGGTYRRPRWEEYPATGVEGCESADARWRPLVW